MVKLFASILRRDANGKHYLVTPVEKVDVAVEDAPFLAVEMEVAGQGVDQQLIFRTNVDDVIVAGRDHPIRFEIETRSGGLKPYVLVRGRLEALVTRPVYYELMDLVAPSMSVPNQLGLWSSGEFFELPGKLNQAGP
jgi:uncharacterized protein